MALSRPPGAALTWRHRCMPVQPHVAVSALDARRLRHNGSVRNLPRRRVDLPPATA
ncbi:hypothetical protein CO2235_10173 [Cupriavidus oxalaticus]|uniref:Uncharacterized protein n=1 Tax=Cupriavidus oxalaticus TaxID=96344 RepID=A0A976G831_9BURK|nr:hypothetical protein CO2235_10173 [Cupriavidus oxalaticus]